MKKDRSIRPGLEGLEDRVYAANIPGLVVLYTEAYVFGTKPSGNVASVAIDPANQNLVISLNGQSQEFARSAISTVQYNGGFLGGDTFTNDSNVVSIGIMHGPGNVYTGGTYLNFAYLYGGDDTFNAVAGSVSDVFEFNGASTVNNPDNALVQIISLNIPLS